mgnify:CR=1 FL=1
MSDKERNTILRFALIFLLITAGFLAVLVKIVVIQTAEREQWIRIAENQIKNNQVVPATRGNILDCEERLLAGSMPQYYVNMDTRVEALHLGGDTLFYSHVGELAQGLSRIIGDKTPGEYKDKMIRSFKTPRRKGYSGSVIQLSPKRINYIQKKQIEDVKPGDVITFFSESIHFCVSHRVQEITYSPKSATENGSFIVSANQEYSLNNVDWIKGGELVSLEAGKSFSTRAIAPAGKDPEPAVSHEIPRYTPEGKTMFYTCGDNLQADWYVEHTGHGVASNYRDNVDSVYYVGTVISHNKFLGAALGTVQSAWFIPVVIMLPILIIAAMSVVDFVKAMKEENAKEKAAYEKALAESGIDTSDEKAVMIFKEKYQYKLDMQRELEEIKKEQKEIYLRELKNAELKKAQEELKKDKEFERIKEEEKRRILEEMKKEEEAKK